MFDFDTPKMDGSIVLRPSAGYAPIPALIDDWILRRKRNYLSSGTRKIDEARRQGEEYGFDQGVSQGLAALANQIRLQMYPKMEWVPAVTDHQVSLLMKQWLEAFESLDVNGHAKDKEDVERRRAARQQWLSECKESLEKFACHPQLEEAELERHKAAVLAKEEPAVATDIEWLEPLRKQQERQLSDISDLLKMP